ncbi:MAG: bifunctional (p)ppGpp synthetase/guanosine-3',5'-bis(diphosphate) 3'-pyrophosphohydrolase [Balneolaceae bacterium]|nr:bifunctional (p)ppGpp synthetase/guanosine-3',5'-bis(diphosphate) 3'-pyrophosphohydrolase [Balneolaceae bacterium]MDR9446816.1 bifunctional (p)ppGpp synthetase/guanosine-3',5'-bis(diphosphate) 3'-pyrophosphohydrolase [Balneolaceae bacterium]
MTRQEVAIVELDKEQEKHLADLLDVCRTHLEFVDEAMIRDAFALACQSHKGATRASGEPYYHHPLEVAKIVASDLSIDGESVVAALIHDTVEDTHVTLDDVRDVFGPTVANLIDGVTKIEGVFKNRQSKQAETFMKLILSMADDIRVVLIKFADRLHNIRTLQYLPREKQMKIASETLDLYAPLAHRFGLYQIKNEFEDLCFKLLDPNSYNFVARKLREKKAAREAFISEFMEPIEDELRDHGLTFEIKGRPKHIYSIYRKMQRQQKPFEEIYDLFAVRVILEKPHTKEDCWRVYSMITDWYTPIPKRFRDFISVPKANGYQSLHTTVITRSGQRVEVQIRTRRMDEIAERGLAAHWKYKEGGHSGSQTLEQFVSWVREVLDTPRPEAATEFVQDFQLNLYQDEIYVFTPKGDLKTLPRGASCIDFAFEIHSEVGERAMAAKVNGKLVPLRQKLKIGDQVDIVTGPKVNVNPDWIEDVVTHKAKARIRQFVRQRQREVSDRGREAWEKRAKRSNIELSDQELMKVSHQLGFDSLQVMFYEIGAEKYDLGKLYRAVKDFKSKGRLEKEEEQKELDSILTPTLEEVGQKFNQEAKKGINEQSLLIDGGLDHVKYHFANCCNPIPGDEVMGFISRAGDVKIHRTSCKNAIHLMNSDGERILEASWARTPEMQFLAAIKLVGEDRVGLINDLTDVLSKSLKTNMKSINVSSDSGVFEGIVTLYVSDLSHLGQIMEKLKRVEGIRTAHRFE